MSISDLLVERVGSCRRDGLAWDVVEDGRREQAFSSAAGIFSSDCEKLIDSNSMKLLACYSAYRSLLAWFNYCSDSRPLRLVEYGIECVLNERNPIFDAGAFTPIAPLDGSGKIVDCRMTDTLSSSTSIAYACRYLASSDIFDFIVSISYAHVAFEVSPIHRSEVFEAWLCKIALPAAHQHRKMQFDEKFAMSDFSFDDSGRIFDRAL